MGWVCIIASAHRVKHTASPNLSRARKAERGRKGGLTLPDCPRSATCLLLPSAGTHATAFLGVRLLDR